MTLQKLEAKMNGLVRRRNDVVDVAQEVIRQANREFDAAARPLAREIARAREALRVREKITRRARTVTLEGTEDWTAEDQAHYLELAKGKQ